MRDVNVGVVGLGNIGSGTLKILAENAEDISLKLGFKLRVGAVCDLLIDSKQIPESLGPVFKTNDWRRLIEHPGLDIVVAVSQRLGYAEANPSNDIDGFDSLSKLAILSALAFGEKITPSDIFTEGIRDRKS